MVVSACLASFSGSIETYFFVFSLIFSASGSGLDGNSCCLELFDITDLLFDDADPGLDAREPGGVVGFDDTSDGGGTCLEWTKCPKFVVETGVRYRIGVTCPL